MFGDCQDSIAKQLRNFDYHCVPPELVSQRLNSFDDDCFLRLEGSYNIWQEVVVAICYYIFCFILSFIILINILGLLAYGR